MLCECKRGRERKACKKTREKDKKKKEAKSTKRGKKKENERESFVVSLVLVELVALLELIDLCFRAGTDGHVSVVDLFPSHDGVEDDVPPSEERLTEWRPRRKEKKGREGEGVSEKFLGRVLDSGEG